MKTVNSIKSNIHIQDIKELNQNKLCVDTTGFLNKYMNNSSKIISAVDNITNPSVG